MVEMSSHLRSQEDIKIFEKMVSEVSEHAGINEEFVWKCGSKAIFKWEKNRNENINALFSMVPSLRNIQIKIILGYFHDYLEVVIDDENVLKKANNIILNYMNEIFVHSLGAEWGYDY